MAKERAGDPETGKPILKDDLCETCHKFRASYLTDVHAATLPFLVRQCKRCMTQTLKNHPASSAVNLHREYL